MHPICIHVGLGSAAKYACAIILVLMVSLARAIPLEDEVVALPGWSDGMPSRHFSGFLSNDDGGFLHYYWVFPEEVDPATAPVIFWTNGGPGCSSLEGWAYELGPFKFMYWNSSEAAGIDGYNGTAPFTRNPYTWARLAHVVFVENPPGVGFSYRTDENNFAINDTGNALSNYRGLVHLFQDKFSEFSLNGLYLSGESYAGIYVPTLANEILQEGTNGRPVVLAPGFRGIIVGNGVTDNTYDNNFATSTGLFAVNHGIMLTEEFQGVVAKCMPDGDTNPACLDLWDTFADKFSNLNPYSFAGWCFNPLDPPPSEQRVSPASHSGSSNRRRFRRSRRGSQQSSEQHQLSVLYQLRHAYEEALRNTSGIPHNGIADMSLNCGDEVYLDRYLNRDDVRAALHIPQDFVGTFRECYDIPYQSEINSVIDIYEKLLDMNKTVFVFNGNMDLVVPYTGTFQWLFRSTNWVVTRDNAPWTFIDEQRPAYGPQTGGQSFQLMQPNRASEAASSTAGGVWVVLVNGAGHMVPEDRPAAALEMLRRILAGAMYGAESPLLAQPIPFYAPDVSSVAFGMLPNAPANNSFWDEHKDLIIGLLCGCGAAQLWCTLTYLWIRRRQRRRSAPYLMGRDDQTLFATADSYT